MMPAAPTDPLDAVTVVVPVGPGDETWRGLLADLATLPPGAAVLFAGAEALAAADARAIGDALGSREWRWLVAPRGRARQLNAGARAATRPFLWFLHADSRVAPGAAAALGASLAAWPDALHYHDLAFLVDGSPRLSALMRLNALGVRIRSRWLGMPFGDQGFCVRRDVWAAIGGFDETAPYGEDHLFVWRARRLGVSLRPTRGVLRTSARRYEERGWLRTTARHVRLTVRQAWPEWRALRHAVRTARAARPAAVAVWVKTPGRSPVKTRLAHAIGTERAESFYRHAVDAVREMVEHACRTLEPNALAPYWAVAEPEAAAHAWWQGFATVAQGEGGLGERLAHVYDTLRARHDVVVFIGADSPQLDPDVIAQAVRQLATGASDFVLGPADDGGFYLFGGRCALPRAAWTEVPYSASTTMAELAHRIAPHGTVAYLPAAFDVDTVDELARLRPVLAALPDAGPARAALLAWLDGHGAHVVFDSSGAAPDIAPNATRA